MVITLTYIVPPRSRSCVLYSIWTRLLVNERVKPLTPRAMMRPVRLPVRRIFTARRGTGVVERVRYRSTHRAETAWETTVAAAAPRTPMRNTKMKTGSSTIFTIAPSATVIMP